MSDFGWDLQALERVLRVATKYTITSESRDSWSLSGQFPSGDVLRSTGFASLETLGWFVDHDEQELIQLVKTGSMWVIRDPDAPTVVNDPATEMELLMVFAIPKTDSGGCSAGPSYEHPWIMEGKKTLARIWEHLPGENEERYAARMRLADEYKALYQQKKVRTRQLCTDPRYRVCYTFYRFSREALVFYKHPLFSQPGIVASSLSAAVAADEGQISQSRKASFDRCSSTQRSAGREKARAPEPQEAVVSTGAPLPSYVDFVWKHSYDNDKAYARNFAEFLSGSLPSFRGERPLNDTGRLSKPRPSMPPAPPGPSPRPQGIAVLGEMSQETYQRAHDGGRNTASPAATPSSSAPMDAAQISEMFEKFGLPEGADWADYLEPDEEHLNASSAQEHSLGDFVKPRRRRFRSDKP
ncbi:MAG: hypothetical protein Q9162_000244 [Coniocarpon cinnabarinum]